MGTPYFNAVGHPPDCRSRAWLDWYHGLLEFRVRECAQARANTYYIAANGNDSNPGTITAPWLSIARAQTAITNSTNGDLALLFRRGDEFAASVGLDLTKPRITVGSYGAGSLPILSAFATSVSTGWTNAAGNRWTRAVATTVGWIRDLAGRLSPYRHMNSTAGVEATPRSWYWASGTLHINPGAGINPNSPAITYEYSGDVNDDGVYVAADGCLVDAIRCDGWGCVAGASYQKYGIRGGVQGTNAFLVRDCEVWYSGRHGIGTVPDSAGISGGFTTIVRSVCGFLNNSANLGVNAFIGYNDPGGQEIIVESCEDRYSELPWTSFAGGMSASSAIYAHTGGSNVSLVIGRGHRTTIDASKTNYSYSNGTFASDPAVTPGTDATISTYRVFWRDMRVTHGAEGRWDTPICQARINCHWRLVLPASFTGSALGFFNPTFTGGWDINNIWDIVDLWPNSGATSPSQRYLTKAHGSSANRIWHCAYYLTGDNAAAPGFSTTWKFNDSVGSITLGNSILTRHGTREFYPGVGNNSSRVIAVASFQVLQAGGSGIDQGVGNVLLTQPAFPFVGAVAGGADSGVEFDFLDQIRPIAAPSIGPIEFAPERGLALWLPRVAA